MKLQIEWVNGMQLKVIATLKFGAKVYRNFFTDLCQEKSNIIHIYYYICLY